MKEIIKKYTNNEITVVWKPGICIHSGNCFNSLPGVFNPGKRPWITLANSNTEKIIDQVKKCPSGALSCYYNDETHPIKEKKNESYIEVNKNGPLVFHGNILIKDADGNEVMKNNVTSFCRCGTSRNKPFCDGMHSKIGFKG